MPTPFENDQALFDHVYNYFSRPGAELSFTHDDDGDIVCQYRGPDGSACAIGCAIPDELYNPHYEGNSAEAIILGPYGPPELDALFANVSPRLIDQMQCAHDAAANGLRTVGSALDGFREIAEERGLTIPS